MLLSHRVDASVNVVSCFFVLNIYQSLTCLFIFVYFHFLTILQARGLTATGTPSCTLMLLIVKFYFDK